jgi:hypothetical protein
MKLVKSASAVALAISLAGALAVQPAGAVESMPNTPENAGKLMDTNNNGKIDRYEFLRYQGRMFDQAVGAKGYATYADVSKMVKSMASAFPIDNSKD